MTPTPSPSESLIGLLQPYVDSELDDAARAAVEARLAADPALQAMVDEQLGARAVLRDLPRESAPAGLRARLLLELDAIDREHASEPSAPPLALRPRTSRARDFLRGALVIAPAAAAAALLFLVVRAAPTPDLVAPKPDAPALAAAPPAPLAAPQAPLLLGAEPSTPPTGVSLVGLGDLQASDDEPALGVTEYAVEGGHALALRRPAPASGALRGTRQVYRGRAYAVARDRSGRTVLAYLEDGAETLLLAATPHEPWARGDRELAVLLDLADRLRQGPPR